MQVLEVLSILLSASNFVAMVAVLVWWQHSRANEILQRWARENGLTVVFAEKRYLRTGPFDMNYSRGQFIFRLVVCDEDGVEYTGWLRVGSWFGGVFSDTATVIWDS